MQILLDVPKKKDKHLVEELASRFGWHHRNFTLEDAEDFFLGLAIKEELKTPKVSEEEVMKVIRKKLAKK